MDKKIIEAVQKQMELDEKNQEDFAAYDDIDDVKYDFGDMLEPWMIPSVSTDGAVALKVLENIFQTQNPHVNVMPYLEADKGRAERLEQWFEFHLAKMGQRGGKSPLSQLTRMSGKYGRILFQVDYLPYWLPSDRNKWNDEQKQQMRAGPFCIDLHNPRNVYYGMGKYGLRWAASVTNHSAEEIIDHWGVYESKTKNGKAISSAVKKIKSEAEENDELRYIVLDYTSYDKRCVYAFKTTSKGTDDFKDIEDFEDMDENSEKITILESDNKLKFLNWVVVECDTSPLLASMHKGNLYAFQTIFNTAVYSGVMRRAFPPLVKSTTVDGKGVNADYTGANPEIKLKPGEQADVMSAPPMDNALFQMNESMNSRVDSSLSVNKLASMSAGGNVQYSTVDAIINLNMNSLAPYQRAGEKALEQTCYLMLKWLEYTGDTLPALRTKTTKPEQIVGEQIMVSPETVSADDLVVTVSLKSKTDKMQAANRISMIKQNGFKVPDASLLEDIGYENADILASVWEDEQLRSAALQLVIEEQKSQLQLKVQEATMQMQMQAQQAQMAQQQAAQDPNAQGPMGQMANPDQSMPSAPQGQGFDAGMGGDPAMMAQPGMTATQVPGERAV